jgi:hypothetical protein
MNAPMSTLTPDPAASAVDFDHVDYHDRSWWQAEATRLPAERVSAFCAELLREHSELEAGWPKGQGSGS